MIEQNYAYFLIKQNYSEHSLVLIGRIHLLLFVQKQERFVDICYIRLKRERKGRAHTDKQSLALNRSELILWHNMNKIQSQLG